LQTGAVKPPLTGLTTVKTVKFTKKDGSCHQTACSTLKKERMVTLAALIIIRRIRYLCFIPYSFTTMRHPYVYCFLLMGLMACEPFDLTRKNFPACIKPTADIGVTIDRLDVTLFVKDQQGDIGAVGWDPGDGKGKSRLGARVTYNYEKAGTYTITMVLVNSCDDKFTKTTQITVQN
jgi:hypothetical protein